MNNNFSLIKIINGLSRTLNIANQMIPLYKQVKPLVESSGKVINYFKNFNINKIANQTSINNVIPNNQKYNSPTFFQ